MARFTAGNFTRIEFVSAASHCVENIQQLHEHTNDENSDISDDNTDENDQLLDIQPATENASAVLSTESNAEPVNEVPICQVCLVFPCDKVALVPCGHAKFGVNCIAELQRQRLHCPLCRAEITFVMNIYQ